jgi:hypothetical protein
MTETFRSIETLRDYPETPEGWYKYWTTELDAADKSVDKWHEGSGVILRAYLDQRDDEVDRRAYPEATRLNYFWSNVKTKKAMLFGQLPKVDVTRRHGDADDDEARISGPLILNRVLNTDIEQGVDGFEYALRYAVFDYLTVGYGNAWVRYEVDWQNMPAQSVGGVNRPPTRVKRNENAAVDYHYWKNQRWSPCRVWEECRWVAKMVPMSRDSMAKRWGEAVAAKIPLDASTVNRKVGDQERHDPWSRAEVWEIWSKELRKVFWLVRGYGTILEMKDDFLRLKNFWPCPRPLVANWTTSALMPRADYAMVQDLYNGINSLASRITLLESALRLAGVYDKNMGVDLNRLLLDRAYENILIPVPNMAALGEKGGLEGVISWLPIQQVAEVIDKLTQKLQEKQQLLYEMTGIADLTRGAPMDDGSDITATQRRMQGRYGNVRNQEESDEIARFASELQNIRAEVIVSNYEVDTILKRSNVLNTPDAAEAVAAVRALKQEFPNYKIEVKADTLAMQDFAALKSDRGEFLQALATLMRDAAPAMQMFPPASMVLLETIKWALAAFRGSASIEGVFDRAIRQAQQAIAQQQQAGPGPQQPDPEVVKAQMKTQASMQQIQAKTQADIAKMKMQVDTERQRQDIQTRANIAETIAQENIKAQSRERDMQMKEAMSAQKLRQQMTLNTFNTKKPKGGGGHGGMGGM